MLKKQDTDTKRFWEKRHEEAKVTTDVVPSPYQENGNVTRKAFLRRIGKVNGRQVLDVGCGRGALSVYLAQLGAHVTAVDISSQAIEKTRRLARKKDVSSRVDGHAINALQLPMLERSFDLAVGKFILHHIEPFERFSEVLHAVLTEGGRGLFLENNAANPLLMAARKHLAGRFGIPKYGDDNEHPLQTDEVTELRRTFREVDQHFEDFVFFRLLSTYLFEQKEQYGPLMVMNWHLDKFVQHYLPSSLNKYSYHQIVEVQK